MFDSCRLAMQSVRRDHEAWTSPISQSQFPKISLNLPVTCPDYNTERNWPIAAPKLREQSKSEVSRFLYFFLKRGGLYTSHTPEPVSQSSAESRFEISLEMDFASITLQFGNLGLGYTIAAHSARNS
jgi:hypothetical protein